jgi:hypothetical protein
LLGNSLAEGKLLAAVPFSAKTKGKCAWLNNAVAPAIISLRFKVVMRIAPPGVLFFVHRNDSRAHAALSESALAVQLRHGAALSSISHLADCASMPLK